MSLTVFVTAGGTAPIMSALRDLAALGLVSPYLWMPADGPGGHCVVVDGGHARAGMLEEELATRDPSTIRVVALTRWSDGGGARSTLESGNRVLRSLPPHTLRVHLVIAEADGFDVPPTTEGGWCNVVISPEDGYRPSAHHRGWAEHPGPAEEGRRVAHSVAGLAGILRGHEQTWTDELRPSERTRVVRVYYRRIDGRRVEKAVHSRLFTMEHGLPKVWGSTGQGSYFHEPEKAAAALAQRWWETARSDLLSNREHTAQRGQTSIGLVEALKLFFTFVVSALVRSPGQWVRNRIRAARDQLTAVVQGHVFGEGSAYQVVLSRQAEAIADPEEFSRALAALNESLPRVEEPRLQFEHTWRALVEGALVLGDGAASGSGMSLQESPEPRSVPDPSSIVAPAQARYKLQSWDLKRRLSIDTVEAGDSMGVQRLVQRLRQLTQDAQLGAAAGGELERLSQWWKRQRVTYGAQTAGHLAEAHLSAMSEAETIADRLRTDEKQLARQEEELAVDQKRARRGVLAWFFMGIGAAVIFVVLAVASILIPGLAAVLVALAIGVAVLGAFATFYRCQRRLFHLLHQIQRTAEDAPILQRNYRAAIADAHRTLQAYEIHQQWMRVLREFLQDPFSHQNLEVQDDPEVSGRMPLAAAIGMGEADDTLVAREVHRLQRKHFSQGWLHDLWGRYMDALPQHLGVDGVHLESAREVFAMRTTDARANLTAITRKIERDGQPGSVGQQAWDSVLDELRIAKEQGRELIPSVRLLGTDESLSREEFNRRFTSSGHGAPFRRTLFDATATTQGLNVPESSWEHQQRDGISESHVVVSFSREMAGDRLIRYTDRAPAPGVDDPDVELDDDRDLF